MKQTVSLLIPAKNVEKTLERAVLSANESLRGIDSKIIVIENGSSDNTLYVAKKLEKISKIPLSVISSKPGKIIALLNGLEYVGKGEPVLFIDGDVEVNDNAFKILLNQLVKHPELIVAGGYPKLNSSYTLADEFAYLNLFTFFPLAKIVHDESYGFNGAVRDPQPNIPADMEKKLKPFFHGRIFCVREKSFIPNIIPENNIADDIFWNRYFFHNYGKGCVRNRYDATVFFEPKTSEQELLKYVARIKQHVKEVLRQFPEFAAMNDAFEVHKNWTYINTLPQQVIQLFEKERKIYSKGEITEKIDW